MGFFPSGLKANIPPAAGGGGGNYDFTNATAKAGTQDQTNTATSASTNTINITSMNEDINEIYITGTWNAVAGGELDIVFNNDTTGGDYNVVGEQWDSSGVGLWTRAAKIQVASVSAAGNEFGAATTFSFRMFLWNSGSATHYALFGGFTSGSFGQALVFVHGTFVSTVTSIKLSATAAMQTSTITNYISNL